MSLVIGFLTFFLILDCVFLVFLVLLQLPKKEAGVGVAFGGGATDALFGAGSGNMLTKITKWSAGIFFGLCLLLAVMTGRQSTSAARSLTEELANRPKANPSAVGAGLLSNTPSAAPAPEATPVKPIPSPAPGATPPATAPKQK
ncbi:MAG: preprotein translocase subunit SecG [Verrucomicrobiales bacterium]|nr:preprotein translocase subunit SecG [Verrucomicrobiales bacterium]